MRIYLDCIPCFIRQSLDAARHATKDVNIHEKVVRGVLGLANNMDTRKPPPVIGQKIHRLIRELAGAEDPYHDVKQQFNNAALKLYPRMRRLITESENPLETAVRLAIAGNIIDFGVKSTLQVAELEKAISRCLSEKSADMQIGAFRKAIEDSENILYLADNAGEIVFDRLLIEQLPTEKITVAVKGSPVINDATMEDAVTAGLHKIVEVIDNGSDAPGTVLESCSQSFRDHFEEADLVIAKGQGNYETLSGLNKNMFFMLQAKCPVISRNIGCDIGEMILQKAKTFDGSKENTRPRKVVIVGGVAGGASAAARLRRLDEDTEIVLFERGKYISFANCGLPYYIGKVITNRDDLLVQTPEKFKARFNIDVRVNSEVTEIDRKNKRVMVKDLSSTETYSEKYDTLILSPGAEPARPPIEGIDSSRIFTLRSIPDADAINNFIAEQQPKRAVVVGGGYIGLEMAENLRNRGMLVAIVEMLDQVMPTLDKEMAASLHEHLHEQSVALWLGDGVAGFRQTNSTLIVALKSGMEISCDMAVLAIGVKPEVGLAKQAGLEIGITGGIKVDERLRTSDRDIFAVGDAIEVEHFVLKRAALIPLAGPANRQGRIAADNVAGRNVKYKGTQGTAVLKVFELTVAMTGATEKELKKTEIEHEKVYIHPANHVGYYPGAHQMHIKILFNKPEGRLLGAQIVGKEGVDKRIDVFATAIRCGLTVFDLQDLELAYAPPYGSGKDPINMAGFAAGNILDRTADIRHFEQLDGNDFLLDVRSPAEVARGRIKGALNIPVNQVRKKLDELPQDKAVNIYCAVGIRSYIASRILKQKGFDARSLPGGYSTYLARTSEKLLEGKTGRQLRDEFCTGF